MDKVMQSFILDLMDRHHYLTLATLREDGYPQATTVGYANDGLNLYFCCDKTSQKVGNINWSNKVSLTIDDEEDDWNKIKGLSMGATARVLTDAGEIRHALDCLAARFPPMKNMSEQELAGVAFVQIAPKVVSVLNYEKGFGHTDLIEV
jgi:nitroimidazol reductase NimA-like FMN-containing flavoprotein (pyridoxamine 5'-phosphate oxidase superfamily)